MELDSLLAGLSLADLHTRRHLCRQADADYEKVAEEKNRQLMLLAPASMKEALREQRVLERLNVRGIADLRVDLASWGPFKNTDDIERQREHLNQAWLGVIVAEVQEVRSHSVRWKLTYALA